jgi:hypothetical protein
MTHTYSVQFRIFGKDLDPDAATRHLGLTPNLIRRAGEAFGKKVWDKAMWSYEGTTAPSEWPSLDDGLAHVLDHLEPKKDLIQTYAATCDLIWWCGHFQSSVDGGPTLSAPLLKRLGDFAVPLYLDNYFSSDRPAIDR